MFGYRQERDGKEYLQVVEFTHEGEPTPTPTLLLCDHDRTRPVLRWAGKAIGIAELTYPHPQGWTFSELDTPIPLDKIRVRHLTRAYRDRVTIPPTCRTAWEKFLGLGELPFHLIWQQLAHPLLTNRDRKNRLRIVNRSLRTRSWATKGAPCRLRCGCGEDRLSLQRARRRRRPQ